MSNGGVFKESPPPRTATQRSAPQRNATISYLGGEHEDHQA
jgi:hypothetical protein